MGKILPISLKLNFTPNTLGCYRLIPSILELCTLNMGSKPVMFGYLNLSITLNLNQWVSLRFSGKISFTESQRPSLIQMRYFSRKFASLIWKIELIFYFAVFTRDPVVNYILVKVLYILRDVLKSFHPHKLPGNSIFSNYVSSRHHRDSTVDRNGLLNTHFGEIRLLGSSWRLRLRCTTRKTSKTYLQKV